MSSNISSTSSINNEQVEHEQDENNPKQEIVISLNALDLAGQTISNQSIEDTKSISSSCDNNQITKSTNSLAESVKNEYNEQEISRLKDLIKQKENDYLQLELKLNEVEQQSRNQIEQLHMSLNTKLEDAIKKIQESQKDKNSMVMKYVEVERKCIELNKTITLAQTKLNDSLKDKQRLVEKLEKSKLDMEKINQEHDKKLKDLMLQQKELKKLKEDAILSDAREKAALLKLKNEHELYLETKAQLDKSNQELADMKLKLSNLNQTSQSENEPTQSVTKESNSINSENIILIEQMNKNLQNEVDKLKKELNVLNSQLKDMFEERTTLRDRVKCLEQERHLQETSLSKYKETLQSQKQLNKELLNENLQLRELQETWTKDLEEKKELEQKLKLYMTELNDLQAEIKQNQEKQNELLLFTSKLTEKNTQLQSENTNLTEKLDQIKFDLEKTNLELEKQNQVIKLEVDKLRTDLNEQSKRNQELFTELDLKSKQVEELTVKLSDEQDENNSLKKKHAANIKDLSKQLQILQKKLSNQQQPTIQENSVQEFITPVLKNSSSYNSQLNQSNLSNQNSISSLHKNVSRTNSINSLNDIQDDTKSLDSFNTNTPTSIYSSSLQYNNEVICGGVASHNQHSQDDVYIVDIDKQKIIDKIVKLQKTLAKRNEKIDFLQDHVNQLTNDLKRKTKIIQAYAMNEDVGAFTSEAQDAIKREMSRKTGIMSTLYNTNKNYIQTANFISSSENHMNMDLCLEINRKLQALLEDTLMKNLTLKESLETLGQEIAKLSKENRDLKLNNK